MQHMWPKVSVGADRAVCCQLCTVSGVEGWGSLKELSELLRSGLSVMCGLDLSIRPGRSVVFRSQCVPWIVVT
jgi:hypothetical protein